MSDSELIEKALEIAICAHKGQLDLDGKPVILHPLTVGLMGTCTDEIVVGFLHDVVEDSDYTFEYLLEQGIPAHIVDTLRLLTHAKTEPTHIVDTLRLLTHAKTETYDTYLERIATSGDRLAIVTKWHDLTHNLERGIRGNHTKQVAKHTRAQSYLRPYYRNLLHH